MAGQLHRHHIELRPRGDMKRFPVLTAEPDVGGLLRKGDRAHREWLKLHRSPYGLDT